MAIPQSEFTTRASKIKLLVSDVDGVLTDGQVVFGHQGELLKSFHIHDGLGIKLLKQAGIEFAVITARKSTMVQERFARLGVQYIFQGQEVKLPVLQQLQKQLSLTSEQIAYIGDDLPDLACIRSVGLGIAVANAVQFVREQAHHQTQLMGGQGAIREVCELILTAQGLLPDLFQQYL